MLMFTGRSADIICELKQIMCKSGQRGQGLHQPGKVFVLDAFFCTLFLKVTHVIFA